MVNLIIIGNGFDLAHGLKTSYKDFIENLVSTDLEKSKTEKKYFNIRYADNCTDIKSLVHILQNRNYNAYHNVFLCDLVINLSDQNWYDIESFYFKKLKQNSESEIEDLNSDFEDLKNELEEYLVDQQKTVKRIDSYQVFFDRFSTVGGAKKVILNFNYTSTLNEYNLRGFLNYQHSWAIKKIRKPNHFWLCS